jgi:hypothetical protein
MNKLLFLFSFLIFVFGIYLFISPILYYQQIVDYDYKVKIQYTYPSFYSSISEKYGKAGMIVESYWSELKEFSITIEYPDKTQDKLIAEIVSHDKIIISFSTQPLLGTSIPLYLHKYKIDATYKLRDNLQNNTLLIFIFYVKNYNNKTDSQYVPVYYKVYKSKFDTTTNADGSSEDTTTKTQFSFDFLPPSLGVVFILVGIIGMTIAVRQGRVD